MLKDRLLLLWRFLSAVRNVHENISQDPVIYCAVDHGFIRVPLAGAPPGKNNADSIPHPAPDDAFSDTKRRHHTAKIVRLLRQRAGS